MKKSARLDKLLLLCTAILLLTGMLSLSLFPAPRYSRREKRYLQELPVLRAEALFSGAWCADMDAYAAQRMPLRTQLQSSWAFLSLALGARESHGVILCRDRSLSRRLPVNMVVFSQNLASIDLLRAGLGELPLTIAVAPRRIEARAAVLPVLYRIEREMAVWSALPDDAVTFPDCNTDAEWFRTDHHWTATGAFHAYEQLGVHLGYTPLAAAYFRPECASKSFLGSSAAAAGIPGIRPDELWLRRAENDTDFRVIRDGEIAEFTGLYDYTALAGEDAYAVFLGGNCGVLEIDLGDTDTRPVLLVIRDSFASAMLPFLAQHFRILAIDPRYCRTGLNGLHERADRALLLCGMQTLTDTPFLSLLRRTK